MIDAALGRKEDALREGRRAVELLPVTKDAWTGAAVLTNLAIIYAWASEKDLAIKQLEELVRIRSPVSYGQLRLHPSGIRCAAIRASRKSSRHSRRNNHAR
jgi:hypothetical protein